MVSYEVSSGCRNREDGIIDNWDLDDYQLNPSASGSFYVAHIERCMARAA